MVKFLEKITIKRTILCVLLVFIVVMLISYFYNPYDKHVASLSAEEFVDEGFTNINDIAYKNEYKKIFGNDTYDFYFNEYNTQFYLLNKNNNEKIYSNDPTVTPNLKDPTKVLEKNLSDIFTLTYRNDINIELNLGSFKYSIQRDDGLDEKPGEKSYSLKYSENSVQVYYEIQDRGVDGSYVPRRIEKERAIKLFYDSFALSDSEWYQFSTQYYEEKEEDGVIYYVIAGTTQNFLKKAYDILYNKGGYTVEDLMIDNPEFAHNTPKFKLCVEYSLEEKGFQAKILKNSIQEDFQIVKIDFLPYFGASYQNTEDGMYIIPDGSGSVINFNNNKGHLTQLNKRVYGSDGAYTSPYEKEKEENLNLPMFATIYNNKNYSYFANIVKGSGHARLNASVPDTQKSNYYNRAYFSFITREMDTVTYGSNQYDSGNVILYTKDIVNTDFVLDYNFVESNSYSQLAKEYQTYLGLEKKQLESELLLDMNLIGVYNYDKFILGVSFDSEETLTTFEEAKIIYEAFKAKGVSNINSTYIGWTKEGQEQKAPTGLKMSSSLGSKKDLENFNAYLADNKISMAYNISLINTREFTQSFFENKYLSRNLGLAYSINYPIEKPIMVGDAKLSTKKPYYTLSPQYYSAFSKEMMKSYEQTKTNSIYLEDLGNMLNSDFRRNNYIAREQTKLILDEVLKNITDNYDYVKMNTPLADYIKYADLIKNVPVNSTLLPIYDYSIPFYQLVISDVVEYCMIDFNESIYTNQYKVLKAIETGSNFSLSMCYKDTSILLTTIHDQFYNNMYTNWIDEFSTVYQELNALNIFNSSLKEHTRLANQVYKVTYQNNVEIIINYGLSSFTYEDKTVSSNDYLVLERD